MVRQLFCSLSLLEQNLLTVHLSDTKPVIPTWLFDDYDYVSILD